MNKKIIRHYHRPSFKGISRDYGYIFIASIWTGTGQNIEMPSPEFKTSQAAIEYAALYITKYAKHH